MAMTTCKECGHKLSDQAEACPSCGAKPPKRTSAFTWFIAAVFGVPLVYAMATSGLDRDRPAAAQPVADKVDEAASLAAAGAVRLKKSMRNPESFKLESALVIDGSNAVCYEYRSQNGFGGVNAGRAVIDPKTDQFVTSEMDRFVALWNKACAGKSGRDVSAAIKMFAL